MTSPFQVTVHDFILISAQFIEMIFVFFLHIAEIDSVPSKVKFFKSGSKVNS